LQLWFGFFHGLRRFFATSASKLFDVFILLQLKRGIVAPGGLVSSGVCGGAAG